MTKKTFFNAVAHGKADVLQIFLDILVRAETAYCVVGGLALNAYTEPVVSLDLDVVVEAGTVDKICRAARKKGFRVEEFGQCLNLKRAGSDLRIQLQTDSRYQDFIRRAEPKEILGYCLMTAAPEDVLQGKLWAYADKTRRPSKRQKDLADILRLLEVSPELKKMVPAAVRKKLG